MLKTLTGIQYLGNDDFVPTFNKLIQNYPNPFNSETLIRFDLAIDGHVSLTVHNELGSFITKIVDEIKLKGKYEVRLDAKKFNLASGTYFYTLQTENFTETKKMIYLK